MPTCSRRLLQASAQKATIFHQLRRLRSTHSKGVFGVGFRIGRPSGPARDGPAPDAADPISESLRSVKLTHLVEGAGTSLVAEVAPGQQVPSSV